MYTQRSMRGAAYRRGGMLTGPGAGSFRGGRGGSRGRLGGYYGSNHTMFGGIDSEAAAKARPNVLLVGTGASAAYAWCILHQCGFTVLAVAHIPANPKDSSTEADAAETDEDKKCLQRAEVFIKACIATYNTPEAPPPPTVATTNDSSSKPGEGFLPSIHDFSPTITDANKSPQDGASASSSVAPSSPDPLRGVKPCLITNFFATSPLSDDVDVIYFSDRELPTSIAAAAATTVTPRGSTGGMMSRMYMSAAQKSAAAAAQKQAVEAADPLESFIVQCVEGGKHVVADVPFASDSAALLKYFEAASSLNKPKVLVLDRASAGVAGSSQIAQLAGVMGVPQSSAMTPGAMTASSPAKPVFSFGGSGGSGGGGFRFGDGSGNFSNAFSSPYSPLGSSSTSPSNTPRQTVPEHSSKLGELRSLRMHVCIPVSAEDAGGDIDESSYTDETRRPATQPMNFLGADVCLTGTRSLTTAVSRPSTKIAKVLGVLGDVGSYALALYLALFDWSMPAGVCATVLRCDEVTHAPRVVEGELYFRVQLPAASFTRQACSGLISAKFYLSNDPDAALAQTLVASGTEGTIEVLDALFCSLVDKDASAGAAVSLQPTSSGTADKPGKDDSTTCTITEKVQRSYTVITHSAKDPETGARTRLEEEIVMPAEDLSDVLLWKALRAALRPTAAALSGSSAGAAASRYGGGGHSRYDQQYRGMGAGRMRGGGGGMYSARSDPKRFTVSDADVAMTGMRHAWMVQRVIEAILESVSHGGQVVKASEE